MISTTEIARQLEALSGSGDDFVSRTYELTDTWVAGGVGIEAVEPVFRFMEGHASVDFGAPGPLVHFVERFDGPIYLEALTASLDRLPTAHTAWMLNRVVNATDDAEARASLLDVMERAQRHPAADVEAVAALARYLDWQRGGLAKQ